jgi:hypothetical protein
VCIERVSNDGYCITCCECNSFVLCLSVLGKDNGDHAMNNDDASKLLSDEINNLTTKVLSMFDGHMETVIINSLFNMLYWFYKIDDAELQKVLRIDLHVFLDSLSNSKKDKL